MDFLLRYGSQEFYAFQKMLASSINRKLTMIAVDIFSGAGGMSLGAIMAGIKVKIAVENDRFAAETYKINHPETDVYCEDIRNISFKDHQEKPFVLFGGPPCQGFSVSNTQTRTMDNKNNTLFQEFIRVVNELRPSWFVFENVEGITLFEKGMVVDKLRQEFKKIGYKTSDKVLLASDYGVPQHRNRFFIVGNLLDINYEFPKKQRKTVTVKQAINDLPILSNGETNASLPYKKIKPSNYAKLLRGKSEFSQQNYVSKNQDYVLERYKHIRQGQNWKSVPKELMMNYANTENCHSGIYRRLDSEKPSIVIANYRKNMLIHPIENRGLSVREAARIQSFPDNFIFEGTLMHIQQQIGNAVPPLLAKAIFNQIIQCTNEKKC